PSKGTRLLLKRQFPRSGGECRLELARPLFRPVLRHRDRKVVSPGVVARRRLDAPLLEEVQCVAVVAAPSVGGANVEPSRGRVCSHARSPHGRFVVIRPRPVLSRLGLYRSCWPWRPRRASACRGPAGLDNGPCAVTVSRGFVTVGPRLPKDSHGVRHLGITTSER